VTSLLVLLCGPVLKLKEYDELEGVDFEALEGMGQNLDPTGHCRRDARRAHRASHRHPDVCRDHEPGGAGAAEADGQGRGDGAQGRPGDAADFRVLCTRDNIKDILEADDATFEDCITAMREHTFSDSMDRHYADIHEYAVTVEQAMIEFLLSARGEIVASARATRR